MRPSSFSGFLDAAALSDGEMVSFSNIARECGVSSPTAKAYFEILVDTLLGRWLSAYRRRRKRRLIRAPKFYFADVGVVNRLTRRGELAPARSSTGRRSRTRSFTSCPTPPWVGDPGAVGLGRRAPSPL